MNILRSSLGLGVAAVLLASSAHAQDGAASASLSLTPEGATATSSGEGGGDYMSRYRPEPMLLELGIFVGAIFPSDTHNLHLEGNPHQQFKSVAPEVGARIGFYPLSFLGAELEGALMPTKTEDDESATLMAGRGHLIAQTPFWSITPFLLGGFGRLAAKSDPLGDDGDPAYHFGGGVKVPINGLLSVRLDIRDNLTQKNDEKDGTLTHHPEVLLGLTGTIGRSKPAPKPPADSDGDGFTDDQDACPTEAGVAPDGCPLRDGDGDGILDRDDKCPTEAGPAPDGCPPKDADGDSFLDDVDKCPTVPGIAPDGCPDPDPDKDGIQGEADKCPNEPEAVNGYLDDDGCPDEIPEQVKKFTGVIEGIYFDVGKATIRANSRPTLDQAATVLTEYPSLRVAISGHTDTDGKHDFNVKLSADRAEAVKTYLVGKGVDASRIETRGAGPDEPIADNKTPAGKQKNRRIEFKLITR